MTRKTAYNKLFRANDELTEVLEALYEALRQGNESARQMELIDYIETAADQTHAAMEMLEGEA